MVAKIRDQVLISRPSYHIKNEIKQNPFLSMLRQVVLPETVIRKTVELGL